MAGGIGGGGNIGLGVRRQGLHEFHPDLPCGHLAAIQQNVAFGSHGCANDLQGSSMLAPHTVSGQNG